MKAELLDKYLHKQVLLKHNGEYYFGYLYRCDDKLLQDNYHYTKEGERGYILIQDETQYSKMGIFCYKSPILRKSYITKIIEPNDISMNRESDKIFGLDKSEIRDVLAFLLEHLYISPGVMELKISPDNNVTYKNWTHNHIPIQDDRYYKVYDKILDAKKKSIGE